MNSDKKRYIFLTCLAIIFVLGYIYTDDFKAYLQKNQSERMARIEASKNSNFQNLNSKEVLGILICGTVKDTLTTHDGYIQNNRPEAVQVQMVSQRDGEKTLGVYILEPNSRLLVHYTYYVAFYIRDKFGFKIIGFIDSHQE